MAVLGDTSVTKLTVLNGITGDLTGDVIGNLTGNASTATSATSATKDSAGNTISTTFAKLSGASFTGAVTAPSVTTGKIHSDATATSTDLTHIPTDAEIALETGNGNGGTSAWIWREKYSSNWGMFHNNSTNVVHFVGNNVSRLSIDLSNGKVVAGGTVTASSFLGNATSATSAAKLDWSSPKITATADMDAFNEAKKIKWTTFKFDTDPGFAMGSNDGMLLSVPWENANYGMQIAMDDNYNRVAIRSKNSSSGWRAWSTLIHSDNYTTYAVPKTRKVNNKELSADISLTASDVGAAASGHNHDAVYVPQTRKINNKALSADISLTSSDVGAAPETHTHDAADITSGTLGPARGGTGQTTLKAAANSLLSAIDGSSSATGDWTDTTLIITSHASTPNGTWYQRSAVKAWAYINSKASSVYVAQTRKVNNKALSADISLTYSDVGAAASGHNHDDTYLKLSGGNVTGSITASKAGEIGFIAENTSQSHKVEFIVGSSGNGGIYDRTKTKWVVYSDTSGNVTLNGNANTATTATNATNLLAYSSNEVTIGGSTGTATNDKVWINFRDKAGGATNSEATQISSYHFGNRKGGTTGVTIYAATFSGSLNGNANTATTATNVSTTAGVTNAARHVWFSDSGYETKRNHDDDFKYNPSTNTLSVGTVVGALTGHASEDLSLAGGQMTGNITWKNSTALPEFSGTPTYLLGIEAFASGGATKWASATAVKVGEATKATQDGSGNIITSTYKTVASLKSKGGQYQPIYFDSSGNAQNTTYTLNKSVPSNAIFTDELVKQNKTTSAKWRNLMLGSVENAAANTAVADTAAAAVYKAQDISAQPSTGTIRALHYSVADECTLTYNATQNCLQFNFA